MAAKPKRKVKKGRPGAKSKRSVLPLLIAAIAVCAATKPDLILSDINMPNVDGLAFVRMLATQEHRPPLIFMSTSDPRVLNTTRELALAHDLTVVGVIGKPLDALRLDALLATFREQQAKDDVRASLSATEVKHAFEEDGLVPAYQAKVDMNTENIVGVEALARLQYGEDLYTPDAFLVVVEESGLMAELTQRMLRQTFGDWNRWHEDGIKLGLSVNMSVGELSDLSTPQRIAAAAEDTGMDLTHLTLEMTESQMMNDVRIPLEVLTRLRLVGTGVAVDDFGIEASTFQQVQRVPCSELKIDKLFVTGAHINSDAQAVLRAGVDVGKRLGLDIVAEGIETAEDWALAKEVGCTLGQGYFINVPKSYSEFAGWLVDTPYGVVGH